jgi:hypothetical protein
LMVSTASANSLKSFTLQHGKQRDEWFCIET